MKIFLIKIAFLHFAGLPLVAWMGIITLTFFLITAIWGWLALKNPQKFPFKVHPILAKISIILALLHGLLALSIFL
jgi:hypothetical protein